MQRPNAASCLLLALLCGACPCDARGKVKVQVVQTHTGIRLCPERLEATSEFDRAWSWCSGSTGSYSKELGFYCGDSRPSPQLQADTPRVDTLFYDMQVIMPNAERVVFHCSTVLDPNCEGLPEYPESTAVVCSDFVYSGAAYKDCVATGRSADGIGVYRAALHGDRVTIFGSSWQRNYKRYGTWYLGSQETQNAKPAQDSKPATDPAAVPDNKADAPADPKPATESAPAKQANAVPPDANTPTANLPKPTAGSQIAPVADQVIDPHIIEQAKAGDPSAQYTLGYDYFLGRGVPVDYVQAAIWWRKAADQGYPEAQNNLGVLYNSGKGVPQSYAEAYFWQNLAASRASGPLQAQFAKNRDESGSKLWLLSRLKVQQRAAKWAADHPIPPRSHEPADAKRENNP